MFKWFGDRLQLRLMTLVVLGLLPALGMATYDLFAERQKAMVETRREVQELAAQFAFAQQQIFDDGRRLLTDLSELPALQAGDWEACNIDFAGLLPDHPEYANFGVIGLDGYTVCSALPSDHLVYAGDRAYFLRALESGDFAIGDYQIGRITGLPGLNFGFPLRDEAGQPIAVLFSALRVDWISDVFDVALLPPDASVTLFTRQGTILARQPNPGDWVGRSIADTSLSNSQEKMMGGEVLEVTGLDGRLRLLASATLPNELFISVGVPVQVAYAEGNQALMRNLAILVLVTAIGLALARWLGSRLIPLDTVKRGLRNQRLLEALSKVMTAMLSARSEVEIYRVVGDEMGRLGHKAAIFVVCEEGKNLRLPYLAYPPALQQAAEKLTGISLDTHRIPLQPGNFFHDVLAGKEGVYSEPFTPVITAALPERARPLANQVADLVGLRQGICVPMQVNGAPYGILMVTGGDLNQANLPIVTIFAQQASLALENVLRLQEIQLQTAALQVKEEEHRNLLDSNADAMLVVNRQGNIHYANPAALKLFELPSVELSKQVFGFPLAIGERSEIEVLRKDRELWVMDMQVLETVWRGTTSLLVSLHDITRRKQAEQELSRSEARYRDLFDNAPISLWEEDFSAVRDYLHRLQAGGVADFRAYFEAHPEAVRECVTLVKIKNVNQRTLELYKAEDKAQLLAGLAQIFNEESYWVFRDQLLALMKGQSTFIAQSQNHTLTGDRIDILLKLHLVSSCEETWESIILSITDISSLVAAQVNLQREIIRTTVLVNTAARLNAKLELSTIMHTVCEEIAHSMDVPAVTFSLYDEDADCFFHGADYGLPVEYSQ